MSRGMPKKGSTPETADSTTVPEVFGGIEESTVGKDDVPITIIRSDPNFEDREKLAEKLYEQDKDDLTAVMGEEAEEGEDREPKDTEADETVAGKPEESEEDEGVEEEGETAAEVPDPESEELTVDGQKIVKTRDEIYEAGKRALQKDLSADKRLEEATYLLRKAEDRDAKLPTEGAAQEPKPKPVPTAEQKESIKALFEKWKYGDDDEGQEALQEMLEGAKATQEDKRETLQAVAQLLQRERLNTEAKRIHSVFLAPPDQDGYADIYPTEKGGKCEDPEVWEFFDYKIRQATGSGEPHEMATYRKAADATRKMFARTPQQDSLAEKRERKRGIDVVQGVKTKTPGVKQDKEESHADIIKWHQKERGQL